MEPATTAEYDRGDHASIMLVIRTEQMIKVLVSASIAVRFALSNELL